jgi:hypothetical protein
MVKLVDTQHGAKRPKMEAQIGKDRRCAMDVDL